MSPTRERSWRTGMLSCRRWRPGKSSFSPSLRRLRCSPWAVRSPTPAAAAHSPSASAPTSAPPIVPWPPRMPRTRAGTATGSTGRRGASSSRPSRARRSGTWRSCRCATSPARSRTRRSSASTPATAKPRSRSAARTTAGCSRALDEAELLELVAEATPRRLLGVELRGLARDGVPQGLPAVALARALRDPVRHGGGQLHLLPPGLARRGGAVGAPDARSLSLRAEVQPLPDPHEAADRHGPRRPPVLPAHRSVGGHAQARADRLAAARVVPPRRRAAALRARAAAARAALLRAAPSVVV